MPGYNIYVDGKKIAESYGFDTSKTLDELEHHTFKSKGFDLAIMRAWQYHIKELLELKFNNRTMKTAKEMNDLANKAGFKGERLLNDLEQIIGIKANDGEFMHEELVENKYTLADADYAITELVANGYKVDQEDSISFLVKLRIIW